MSDDRWIVVRNWNRFQHYSDRDPRFIKNYVSLLHDDDYLQLSGHTRSVLHGLWLAYASSNGRLRVDTASLSRQLGLRVSSRQLDSLNEAGFIDFSASRPLALTRSREKRRVEEKEDSPVEKRAAGRRRTPRSDEPPPPRTAEQEKEAQRRSATAWIDNALPHLDGADLGYVIADQFRGIDDQALLADLIAYAQERRIERGSHERA